MFKDPPTSPEQRKRELENIANDPLLQSFRDNIRTEVARDLHKFRAREKEFSEIEPEELLLIYLNWKYRQIHPHPRTVVYSAELSERIRTNDALYAPVKSEFNELTRIITIGEDLLSHQSSGIVRRPYELKPDYSRLNREEHLDLLLNEQGIHHLHLPGLQGKPGTPIVFAIFEPAYAVLLDLAAHNDYQTDRLARISYANWPGRHFRKIADTLLDAKGNEVDLKDQQRISLRNNAIAVPIKVADRTYVFPTTNGVVANGFAFAVVTKANNICRSLVLFAIRRNRARFDDFYLDTTGQRLPHDPVFRFIFYDTKTQWEYAILEEKTPFAFLLPNNFGIEPQT